MKKFALAALFLVAAGCSDAERARVGAIGQKHTITVYSGGKAVKVYHSTGKVYSEEKSDGWYFMNAENNKLVRVSGNVIVEAE